MEISLNQKQNNKKIQKNKKNNMIRYVFIYFLMRDGKRIIK